jgi:hypothetical protein
MKIDRGSKSTAGEAILADTVSQTGALISAYNSDYLK